MSKMMMVVLGNGQTVFIAKENAIKQADGSWLLGTEEDCVYIENPLLITSNPSLVVFAQTKKEVTDLKDFGGDTNVN